MLENRAFDHMLGFSGITGTDAVTGQPTSLNGLAGNESNSWNGKTATVSQPADEVMAVDPGHEFPDVLCQLAGPAAKYVSGGAYPAINNSGFMASYSEACAKAKLQRDPAEILQCYSPEQLPVLNALAKEFAVCDNWHASMPGPTWPNRRFVHGASSGGLDHSPSIAEIALWEVSGFGFPNGTIFDRLKAKGVTRRLYAGDRFPMMGALKGIHFDDIRPYEHFAADLQGEYDYSYTFIEPSYNLEQDYKGSTSQHPLDDIRLGEGLIKSTYEAIRSSAVWPNSLLIVTWDEHGGFYDHVAPPAAVAPGDTKPGTGNNQFGFTFEQYGLRVPAVVISPFIPQNTIDHRLYDHASIPATIEKQFGLAPLTERDKAANTVLPLVSLSAPRNTPVTLPTPSPIPAAARAMGMAVGGSGAPATARPNDSVNEGNLPIIVQAAMHQDLDLSPANARNDILARVAGLKTREDAARYMSDVAAKRPRTARAAQ